MRDSTFADWVSQKRSRASLRFGLSFRGLRVHGFSTALHYQPTVLSWALSLPRFVASLFSLRIDDARVQILHDFHGLVRSGEMLLVLGRPGSGCTTFLKALAGDTHGIFVGHESEVNYEGITYEEMHGAFKGESIYLAEFDVHFAELTLGQTLGFAASTRESGSVRKSISQKLARDMAVLLGLEGAFGTWIGDAMIRGVSGGEKRRTSLAEALICGAHFQCWDNSIRGLDSSTSLRSVKLLRDSSNQLQTTVAMSIYQASDLIYEIFDKVTILYQGRQIYFGPTASAAQYFYDLGFARPSRATIPDFLTSLTNPAERLIRTGYENRVPRSPDDFARTWKQSAGAAQLLSDIDEFNRFHPLAQHSHQNSRERPEWRHKLSLRASTYSISIRLQILSCLERAVQRFLNQPAPVIGSIVANAILALILGSVYYDTPENAESMDTRAVLIFFSLLVTAYSPAFEVLTIWAQRPIVEKHDRYALYHPFADAAASMIFDLPNKFVTALLFQLTLYFMANLRRTPGAFFTWFLFNFVLVLNMSMWFRFVGSISRTMAQSTAPTCIMVLLSCIYGGFVVPAPYMVGWLGWFRFVNPIAYTFESLMINEFSDREFPCSNMVPHGPSYADVGLDNQICAITGAEPGETRVQGGIYLAERYTYASAHLWRNLGIIVAMTIVVCGMHLLAAEYILAQRSKGDVLRYKRVSRHDKQMSPGDSEVHELVRFTHSVKKKDNFEQERRGISQTAIPSIPSQSSVFNWESLSYDVKTGSSENKRILDGIDGWVKPGTLTALMGVTGAGKTTLLDVLANRASFGTASGKICIDGKLRDSSFQRKTGYAQQEDIHLPTTTVREALEFSAALRQSNSSNKERLAFVDHVIDLLDLGSYSSAIVGVPGDGLNIEQRKRLTIGVELVAKPELVLFLDEPTSGLDSQTAWSICMLLRKLADNGQAILCTIHQPSSQLFCIFDRLLLLNEQGQNIYFGDIGHNSTTLISYFEENGAERCEYDANPAEWMLHVSTKVNEAENTSASGYWAEIWSSSLQKEEVLHHIAQLRRVSDTAQAVHQGEYAVSWTKQLVVVTRRLFQNYWRDPMYLYSKLVLCAGVALFNGLSFQNARLDVQGLQNLIFSMFLHTQMFGTVDQQVIPRFIQGRALFEARESRSKIYCWTVFITSNIVVELVWQTVAAVLVYVAWYYPTGLWRNGDDGFDTHERSALTFTILLVYCLWISTFSQAVAAGIEHEASAVQAATLMFWFSLVFCGVIVPPNDLPGFWTFVWRASPLTYLINGLAVAGLENADISCSPVHLLIVSPPNGANCGDYFAQYLEAAGGTVLNPVASSDCEYCPITNANSFLYEILEASMGSPWNNVGYFTVFMVFNVLATFGFYWLVRIPRKKSAD